MKVDSGLCQSAELVLLFPFKLGEDSELLLIRSRRIFSAPAPFTSALNAASHDSRTEKRDHVTLTVVFCPADTTRHVLLVSRSDTSPTSMPSAVGLYSRMFENRSNAHAHAHPCRSRLPCRPRPQFFDSPLSLSVSSSRTPASCPMLRRLTSCSTHRSMMCVAKEWTKWFRHSDYFPWSRVARSPPESSQLAISFGK
ncbi:MAG: hypothetical protein J07HQW2_03489 [Haloquadratum walsbyi J07HQW2]|uniref:Uncharacterized protein n=1 Tax=Haloquadratum walsbyi J07HQW2 TaxID=1238425 RepID=U1NJ99_9EURY|nr:MAG: hypothetical protein J07HQW2_03489 [Haloquadratum walsbyi J07HQW2]